MVWPEEVEEPFVIEHWNRQIVFARCHNCKQIFTCFKLCEKFDKFHWKVCKENLDWDVEIKLVSNKIYCKCRVLIGEKINDEEYKFEKKRIEIYYSTPAE